MDPNRLGLFDSKNKILKDRKALISQHKEVADSGEVFVKDLGRPTLGHYLLHFHC